MVRKSIKPVYQQILKTERNSEKNILKTQPADLLDRLLSELHELGFSALTEIRLVILCYLPTRNSLKKTT